MLTEEIKDKLRRQYKSGVTVIPVHLRELQNCDTTFDRVFGDDNDHASLYDVAYATKIYERWNTVRCLKLNG